jgi:hypothetical protein
MNVSAWSIRNPIPALMLFVLLTLAACCLQRHEGAELSDIDLPMVTVTVACPARRRRSWKTMWRARSRTHRHAAGPQAHHTKVQDGGATITAEFRLEKPVQEAVDDVRSAVSRVRADLPGDLRDPIVTKMDLAAQPILAFTVASPRMDDEALSWFVDNTLPSCWPCAAWAPSTAWAAWTARCAWRSIRSSCRRWAPRPTCRASCARCSWRAPAAAPTWAAPSSPCARWPRCRRRKSWPADLAL